MRRFATLHVGDSAETIALLCRQLAPGEIKEPSLAELPLDQWMAELLPRAAALEGDAQAAAVRSLWRGLEAADDPPRRPELPVEPRRAAHQRHPSPS